MAGDLGQGLPGGAGLIAEFICCQFVENTMGHFLILYGMTVIGNSQGRFWALCDVRADAEGGSGRIVAVQDFQNLTGVGRRAVMESGHNAPRFALVPAEGSQHS